MHFHTKMSTMAEYRNTLCYISRREIIQERLDLLKDINENASFPVKGWPSDMRLTFWKKLVGKRDTFKLVLHLLGNGCSHYLLKRWIMPLQFQARHPTSPANRFHSERRRLQSPRLVLLPSLSLQASLSQWPSSR